MEGIPYRADENALTAAFERFGPIEQVAIVRAKNGMNRGFGFVTFHTSQSCRAACVNAVEVGGKVVSCSPKIAQRNASLKTEIQRRAQIEAGEDAEGAHRQRNEFFERRKAEKQQQQAKDQAQRAVQMAVDGGSAEAPLNGGSAEAPVNGGSAEAPAQPPQKLSNKERNMARAERRWQRELEAQQEAEKRWRELEAQREAEKQLVMAGTGAKRKAEATDARTAPSKRRLRVPSRKLKKKG